MLICSDFGPPGGSTTALPIARIALEPQHQDSSAFERGGCFGADMAEARVAGDDHLSVGTGDRRGSDAFAADMQVEYALPREAPVEPPTRGPVVARAPRNPARGRNFPSGRSGGVEDCGDVSLPVGEPYILCNPVAARHKIWGNSIPSRLLAIPRTHCQSIRVKGRRHERLSNPSLAVSFVGRQPPAAATGQRTWKLARMMTGFGWPVGRTFFEIR
jgi:hypothetical protein